MFFSLVWQTLPSLQLVYIQIFDPCPLIYTLMHNFFIEDELPGTNFAYHCEKPVDPAHPFLLRCPKIEENIIKCQKRGKIVLISMGGATGDGTLGSAKRAKKLAHNIWNLFLGGKDPAFSKLRGFGRWEIKLNRT